MNFLAHIFLSGDNRNVQVGNFIGDFVKGSKYKDYESDVKQGILLHRAIDEYFDNIDIVRKLRRDLSADYGRYAGVALDLIFDYYLASQFCMYHNESLKVYSQSFYNHLKKISGDFDKQVKFVGDKMIELDWLNQYISPEGMQSIAMSLERRIGKQVGFERLAEGIYQNNEQLSLAFQLSFPEMQQFAFKKRLVLQGV
jgi:acyl carrier protein phosphodiesterase